MSQVVVKPWGSYENLATQEIFNLKKLIISPGQQISYQYHQKRAEHWIILKGKCEVTIDDTVKAYEKNDCIYVPIGSKHRIKNTSHLEDLIFIEIQTGTYFGEDDIVRLQDDYNRS